MKALSKVIALFVMLGIAGFAQAEDGAPKAEKAPKAKAEKAPKAKSLKGVVKEVQGDKVVVTVGKGEKAKDVTVATDASTKVVIEGKDAAVADLKAGQEVTVTPDEGTATKIEVKAPKAPKAPKAEKAKEGEAK